MLKISWCDLMVKVELKYKPSSCMVSEYWIWIQLTNVTILLSNPKHMCQKLIKLTFNCFVKGVPQPLNQIPERKSLLWISGIYYKIQSYKNNVLVSSEEPEKINFFIFTNRFYLLDLNSHLIWIKTYKYIYNKNIGGWYCSVQVFNG